MVVVSLYNGAEFPVRFFFSLQLELYLWVGNRFPLTHRTSVLRAQITSQSGSHCPVSAQRSLSSQRYTFRCCCSPSQPSSMVFSTRCKCFVEDQRPCTRTQDLLQGHQVYRSYLTVLSATSSSVKAFCGCAELAVLLLQKYFLVMM